jgi:RNA polymerase sigma-70 factor, ECF subfamily
MEAALTTRGEANSPRAGSEAGDALASLVARAALGEERAWEELVHLYAGRVYALAQSRLRRPDLAEEITQSVFVTIATKLKDQQYAEQGRFEPWLFRVTMNRVRDTARRMKRQAGVLEPGVIEAMAAGPGVQTGADTDETASLRQALETLNDADREVIELRHHGRMGFKEIAELLGEPVGTVLARHHRALRKLRSVLEPDRTSEDLS